LAIRVLIKVRSLWQTPNRTGELPDEYRFYRG
jgi:hypothetical protein